MCGTIQFDNDTSGRTIKVYNITANRMLSSELDAAQTSLSQHVPHNGFDTIRILP